MLVAKGGTVLIKQNDGVVVWRANTAIRKLYSAKKLPIYVSNGGLDKLAKEKPDSYLSELELWMWLLMNQLFYSVDGNEIKIVCANVFDGKIVTKTFGCQVEDGALRILDVSDGILGGLKWKSVKAEGRK